MRWKEKTGQVCDGGFEEDQYKMRAMMNNELGMFRGSVRGDDL